MDGKVLSRGNFELTMMLAGAAAVFSLMPMTARAADLGGNCCADLEERIAELEGTAGLKGNTKVTLTASGSLNAPQLTFGKGSYVIDLGRAGVVTTITPGTAAAVSGSRVAVVDSSSFTHEDYARRSVLNGAGNVLAAALDRPVSCVAPVHEHSQSPQQCTRHGVWAVAMGGFADIDGTGSAFEARQTLIGGMAGTHFVAAPGIAAGLFGGYAETDLETAYDAESVETSFVIAGGYARVRYAQGFADLNVTGLWSDSDRRRNVLSNVGVAPGFETATANVNGWTVSPALTLGLRLPVNDDTDLVPAVNVRGMFGQTGGFTERGSSSNFTAQAHDIADVESRIELSIEKSFVATSGLAGVAHATAGLSYFSAFGDDTISGTLLGQTVNFARGAPDTEFGGYVGFGLDMPLSASAILFADTELHLTDRAQNISGFGGVRLKF